MSGPGTRGPSASRRAASDPAPPDPAAPGLDLDAITVEQLRAAGGKKWTQYPDCLGSFIAEMDFGTAPAVRAALERAVRTGALGYLSAPARAALVEAVSRRQRAAHGWAVDPGHVRLLPDVHTTFAVAIEHLSPPGSPIVLPTPTYMPFVGLPHALGRRSIPAPLRREESGRWVMDLDAIESALRQGARLVLLCNPHNPTGRVYERAELLALAEVVERHGARVFADEIHSPIVFEGAHVPYASLSAETARHTVTAVSASKAWNIAGTKCAQLILTSAEDRRTWDRVGPIHESATSPLGVLASTAAYDDGAAWLRTVLAHLDGNRRRLADSLAELLPTARFRAPEGTYLAWVDVREAIGSLGPGTPGGPGGPPPLDRLLRERAGVAVVDGRHCGPGGEGHIRLDVATPRPILTEVVQRIAGVLG